jgi:hypothetical protein
MTDRGHYRTRVEAMSGLTRAVAGTVVLIVAVVAGAAMSFAGQVPTPVSDQQPGTCHLAEDPNELIAIPSDSSPAVPCSQPHQTEVMWVTKVSGPVAASKVRPNGELLNHTFAGLCFNYTRERAYMGAGRSDVTYGIESWSRFPTAAAWAKGDRTLVCQGSAGTTEPGGPTIDFPIADVMRTRHSATFRLCRSAAGYVTCNLPHTAEEASPDVNLTGGPWPGIAGEEQMAVAACTEIVDFYIKRAITARPDLEIAPDPISETQWNNGERTVSCWVANANDLPTTGSVRGGLT